jgi:hypothetical protein
MPISPSEQPKDLPADSVVLVDEQGRPLVDGKGRVIVSSRSTKKDSN